MERRISEPIPLYAQGYFYVNPCNYVDQIVIFDYFDPSGYYDELSKDPELLEDELRRVRENMQYYLDLEKVVINGKRSMPKVHWVKLGFRGRKDLPYLIFHISFAGDFAPGLNVYEDTYEEEVAEYDYSVHWFFPIGARVTEADLGVDYELLEGGRVLRFSVGAGTYIRGYERIAFELAPESLRECAKTSPKV